MNGEVTMRFATQRPWLLEKDRPRGSPDRIKLAVPLSLETRWVRQATAKMGPDLLDPPANLRQPEVEVAGFKVRDAFGCKGYFFIPPTSAPLGTAGEPAARKYVVSGVMSKGKTRDSKSKGWEERGGRRGVVKW
jgi:hypothetical protein